MLNECFAFDYYRNERGLCDYPKTFMWRGWHPRSMCSISPILMDRKSDEWKKLRAMSDEDYKKYQSPNLVKNVPDKFKKWCDTNKNKLNAAREKGKLPYFVRDNEKVVGEIVGWVEEKTTPKNALSSREKILAAAKARHDARTDEQINDILSRWDERKYSIEQRENFRSMEKTWDIKREVSMDFEKANQGRGNINYSKGNAYKVNCQSSVVAHELRLRGFDVTAQPNWKIDDDPNKLSSGTWQCWKNQDGTPMQMPEAFAFKFKGVRMSGTSVKETMQLIEEHTQEAGRYHVSFSWKGRRYGHIVTMERKADGTALWYDPQSGKRDFFDKEYAKKIYYVRAYRVDNLLFDPKWNVVRPLAKEALETSYYEAVANYIRLNGKKPKYSPYKNTNAVETYINLSPKLVSYRKTIGQSIQNGSSQHKNLLTNNFYITRASIKKGIAHARSIDEVNMFKYVCNNPSVLKNGQVSKLGATKNLNDPKEVHKILKKKSRGVTCYNVYTFTYNGDTWIAKCEVYKNKKECLYTVYKK